MHVSFFYCKEKEIKVMGKHFLKKETVRRHVKELKARRDKMLKTVDELHVRLQRGNDKTGPLCWTVSLIPIVDCSNCSECMWQCYDLRNDCRFERVRNDRCRNSAIHMSDPERFWNEIDTEVKKNFVTQLRINVGGDLLESDFGYIAELGKKNPKTMILFFTKNYKGINSFLDSNEFPENVKPIMSCWENMEMSNPHQLPCSHVLYEDGRTTAPQYGAIYCGGNCSECAFKDEGCWNLKKNEHVIFKVH